MTTVVLLGAGGLLARAVAEAVPAGVRVLAYPRSALDITDTVAVAGALAHRPDWVINCAAWTRVDDAEAHEAEATRVNGVAVEGLARAAAQHGVRVLHLSTDYVFDGLLGRPYREDDAPNPPSAYGRSKRAGEVAVMAAGGPWIVVRTQWLYGGGPSFVRTMWQRAQAGQGSRVVDDQWGAPTHVRELASVLWRLVGDERQGVFHAAAGGATTWYDVARAVYAGVGADPGLVLRCSTADFGARAPRPANGRLDTGKIGGLRAWREVLDEVLRQAGPSAP